MFLRLKFFWLKKVGNRKNQNLMKVKIQAVKLTLIIIYRLTKIVVNQMTMMEMIMYQMTVTAKKTTSITTTTSTIKKIPTLTQTSTAKIEVLKKQHKISKKIQINMMNKLKGYKQIEKTISNHFTTKKYQKNLSTL